MKQGLAAIRERAANWLWNDFLAPRHKWRFKMRIALRVNWLFFKRWWGESVSLGGLLRGLRRPTALLLIGLGLPLLVIWLIPFAEWEKPVANDGAVQLTDELTWKELIQPALLLIGVPSAFVLWAFRDHNAKSALENQRKDINLKEFQEIQLRAAGALDEKLPAKARQTLQIAAIHQLRPFLRGEYGSSFRRPAWELLKALLATSADASGYVAIREWVEAGGFPAVKGKSARERALRNADEIWSKIAAIRPDAVAIAARTLIDEDVRRLFRRDLPLEDGAYDGVNLESALLARIILCNASFVGANLGAAHLESAVLFSAHLEGANLVGAHLEGANLGNAHLEGANLVRAHLEGSILNCGHLQSAQLIEANLTRASLQEAHLEGANLNFANLEGATLRGANLRGTLLHSAHLASTSFRRSHLEGADLMGANLNGADLYGANLKDADLGGANLNGADLRDAHADGLPQLALAFYNETTRFAHNWDTLTEAQREAARQPWRDRGMIHVSEVKGG
jgi:uncharacterized protein YjbI with pentapeptide repeats